MSGSVRISLGNAWTPAGWVFDNVLGDVAAACVHQHPRLARSILEATEGFQYLDASHWTADEMGLFLDGALASRDQRLRAGAAAFQKPEFFPGFMAELDIFIEQLRADPRVHR